jgi:glycosyltransferase involved in cell wall biosynthesis
MLIRDLIDRRNWLAKSIWIQSIERSNLAQSAAVHLTSRLEAEELERFGWQLPRLSLIPNGVDEPTPSSDEVGIDVKEIAAEQPLVLFLGRLSWKKGLDRLLRAFACTKAGELAIAGTDDEGLAPRLLKLAASLRIDKRVRILPRTVVGAEKEHLFAAAQLFVLSSYSENFGNTVLEALRRGVPVVVTPEVGAADIVQKSKGGIVAQGNAEAFGAAIGCLLDDPNLARSMGEAGQRHVTKYYSWASVSALMEELYESIRLPDSARSIVCDEYVP